MAWIWQNTYLAAAVAGVAGVALLLLRRPSEAAFAAMVVGCLLMMRSEAERAG